MITATPTKTSHEVHTHIIENISQFIMWLNYPRTKLVGMTFKLRNGKKPSPSCAHVQRKTSSQLVILRRCFTEDG